MQVVDEKSNIYMNEYGYCFVLNSQNQVDEKVKNYLDNQNSLNSILENDFVDEERTLMLHSNPPAFNSKDGNQNKFVDMTEDFVLQTMKMYGENNLVWAGDIDLSKYMLERFKNLGVKIVKHLEFYQVYDYDFRTKDTYIKLKKNPFKQRFNFLIQGLYDIDNNLIELALPVFFMKMKREMSPLFIDILWNAVFDRFYAVRHSAVFTLIHELKHTFDDNMLIQVLRNNKISFEDFMKLQMFTEKAAEIQSILYRIAEYEKSDRKINFFDNSYLYGLNYFDVKNFVDNNKDYWKQKDEFFSVVYTSFLKNYSEYAEKYFLNNAKDYVSVCPLENLVKETSDRTTYLKLKKEMFLFDVYNPKTKQWELQDWADMFEEKSVNRLTLFNFSNFIEKEKVKNEKLMKRSSISNEIIQNMREKQNLKLEEIRKKQLYQK